MKYSINIALNGEHWGNVELPINTKLSEARKKRGTLRHALSHHDVTLYEHQPETRKEIP